MRKMVVERKSASLLPYHRRRGPAHRHENDIHIAYNMTARVGFTLHLSRDCDLDFDTRLQADARLGHAHQTSGAWRVKEKTLTICLTISLEEWRSIKRLWILSS